MSNKIKIILGVCLLSGVVIAASITKFYGDIDMQSHKISNLATPTANADGANKTYVDTQITTAVASKLDKSGGTMNGALSMGGNKITSVGTPTASADATTKAYVDTLVHNSPSLIDSFLFYTMSGGTTNEARIFDVNATGGYVRVAMLADNGGGLYNTITATMSEGTDTATVVRAGSTQKAGSGFKVWLTSSATNTHYSSLKIRDGGDGGSVALIKFNYNYYITPDWGLWYKLANNAPQKWTGDAYYDAHPAYEGGYFIIQVGMTNTTARTISLQCSLSAATMETPASPYSIDYPNGSSANIPPYGCIFLPAHITDFVENKGACIYISIACGETYDMRTYGTFISLPR